MEDLQVTTPAGAETVLGGAGVEEFKANLRGRLLVTGDDGYDEARVIWNAMADKRPALIARCSGVADVIDAVNFARTNNLRLAVRGGGHNVAGNAVCDGGIVIDLSSINGVRVDPAARRVRAGGGATLGHVDRETQAFGLATPLGVVSLTGIAGLTLCGGLGWLCRKHGMACDALVSVDMVTADGSFVTASKQETPDRCCQVKMNGPPKTVEPASSGRKLTPLGKGGGAVEFEVFAAAEVTFLVEVIED